jgi:hypothetical protein
VWVAFAEEDRPGVGPNRTGERRKLIADRGQAPLVDVELRRVVGNPVETAPSLVEFLGRDTDPDQRDKQFACRSLVPCVRVDGGGLSTIEAFDAGFEVTNRRSEAVPPLRARLGGLDPLDRPQRPESVRRRVRREIDRGSEVDVLFPDGRPSDRLRRNAEDGDLPEGWAPAFGLRDRRVRAGLDGRSGRVV